MQWLMVCSLKSLEVLKYAMVIFILVVVLEGWEWLKIDEAS